MRECDRCGITVASPGLCDDCAEILSVRVVITEVVPRARGYKVTSSRRGNPQSDHHALVQRCKQLSEAGWSANEIAVELGYSSRTIARWRREAGVDVGFNNPWGHTKDLGSARKQSIENGRKSARSRSAA